MSVRFGERTLEEFHRTVARYPVKEAALLPTLRLAEREFGSITDDAMIYVAELLDLPPARVHGVFTFYTHFRRPGWGRHVLQVCCTLPCALRGALDLVGHLKRRLGIDVGGTTADGRFTLLKVECLASCGTAPALQVNDVYHENLTIEQLDALLAQLP
jgi:NADH-quinone oxidoreductase E subunit